MQGDGHIDDVVCEDVDGESVLDVEEYVSGGNDDEHTKV